MGRLFSKSLVVAFSVALLSAASLFVRHLSNLEHLELGFQRDHVLLLDLNPAGSGYGRGQLSRAYQELLERPARGLLPAAKHVATPYILK